MIKKGIFFIIIIALYSCGPKTEVEYKGEIKAVVINYEIYDKSVVLNYMLGDTEIIDEIKDVPNAHVQYLARVGRQKVPFDIEVSSSSNK